MLTLMGFGQTSLSGVRRGFMPPQLKTKPHAKKSEFLVNLDHFSKYLKYLRNFEKWSKLTKNSDFFARGECATLYYQFEQRQYFKRAKFSVKMLQFLKDAVITVGVSFRLCSSFSVGICWKPW
jgi:hypothetical protein